MKFLLVCAAAAVALLGITVAFAHAEPATVKPGDGAVLNRPPTEISIEMTQEMARQAGANDIVVFDATGKQVTTVAATIDNNDRKHLSVPLPTPLPAGAYTVKWKTLSADDGDAADGQLSFTYDPSKPPSAGKENIVDLVTAPAPSPSNAPQDVSAFGSSGGGTSWALVAAVAVGMFAIGSGGTFLLVRKKGT